MDRALIADAARYLAAWLEYRQRTLAIPGLVAAVGHDGELLLHRAYGVSDVETGVAMTADRPFPVASHSKTFTAALVLRLVEQGLVRLDDHLSRWLPTVDQRLGDVSIGELLSHSSGVTRDGADCDFWQLDRPFPTAAELLAAAAPVLGRNERFKYSNVGFALLGQVVEAVCGEPFAVAVTREVVAPLGLTATSADPAGRDCPTGYTARRGGAHRVPLPLPATSAFAPATGFCATAADLVTFATALCDGEAALLGADTRRAMRRVAWVGERGDDDYGMGLMTSMVGDRRIHGHGGAFPGFITATRFDAGERVVTVALCNAIDAPAGDLARTMQAVIGHAQGCGPAVPAPPDDVTGRYTGVWGTYDVVRLGSQLLAFDPELADPLERRLELRPDLSEPGRWTVTRGSGYGSPGERVTFAGETARFGGMTMRRESRW